LDEPEQETRNLLEKVARSSQMHWCHSSKFWIADVDGKPAAALCGFTPATENTLALANAALCVAADELGYSESKMAGISERLEIALSGLPEDLPTVWGVENVAVLPEYRGKGLVDRLLTRVLEEGMEHGFKHAQILCLIGNERAERVWIRNGFKVQHQQTSKAFEALMGCPGTKLLARDLLPGKTTTSAAYKESIDAA
jgi:ribosomal protein S18 acetylase RimI-like enzyme